VVGGAWTLGRSWLVLASSRLWYFCLFAVVKDIMGFDKRKI